MSSHRTFAVSVEQTSYKFKFKYQAMEQEGHIRFHTLTLFRSGVIPLFPKLEAYRWTMGTHPSVFVFVFFIIFFIYNKQLITPCIIFSFPLYTLGDIPTFLSTCMYLFFLFFYIILYDDLTIFYLLIEALFYLFILL